MSPPMGHLGMQSRRPVGQHPRSPVANDSPRARRGRGLAPPSNPAAFVGPQVHHAFSVAVPSAELTFTCLSNPSLLQRLA